MKVLSWINFILGLWLVFVGFTMGRGVPGVMTEEIILGIIIAALSLAVVRTGNTGLSWLIALAGLWTLLAPTVINYTAVPRARGNDITVGVIVLILGVVNALYRPAAVRTHI
jgi:SPW repeat-containing protein